MASIGAIAPSYPAVKPAPAPTPKTNDAAIAAAEQAQAAANSAVETDKRNHSPDCVACDQKKLDKADLAVAQAKAGSVLDITL